MTNYTRKELGQKFQEIPEDLQELILSTETADKVYEVGSKHFLHIDQIGELADEIGLVMLGINKANNFVNHVADRLGIEMETASAITKDVNEQIFMKIRESLQKLHTGKEEAGDKTPTVVEIKKEESADLFEQKMGKLFRIPREEVELDPYL